MISSIDGMFLAMTIFSAFGTIISLAGSIVGCMGTCCARNQVIFDLITFYNIDRALRALRLVKNPCFIGVYKMIEPLRALSLVDRCGKSGEFSKVMQTLDYVSGLHNCLEFSQPSSCLYEAI